MKLLPLKKNIFKSVKLTTTLVLCQFTIVHSVFAVDVSINGSENLALVGDIEYQYQLAQPTIEFDIVDPFICTSTTPDTLAPITLEVNGSTLLTGNKITSANYVAANANSLFKVTTNSDIQCASAEGIYNETIYVGGFESTGLDFSITLLDENNTLFVNPEIANDQVVEYHYKITNNGEGATVDILESYLTVGTTFVNLDFGADWTCVSTETPTNCGSGNGPVSILDMNIAANETITLTVIRKASVPVVGPSFKLDLLAAVFVKNKNDLNTINNTVLQEFSSANNSPPTIAFTTMPAFVEDTQSTLVNFTVNDVNMDNSSIVVTASSSDASIIPNLPANIIIGGGGSNRTIQLVPAADANTETDNVSITITANDGITTATKVFNVTINPVNDIPSFTFSCLNNVFDSQTLLTSCNDTFISRGTGPVVSDFIDNISLGNDFDDDAQSVIEFEITDNDVNDPNGIISQNILNHYEIGIIEDVSSPGEYLLEFDLNPGFYGIANITVRLKDSGGLPGIDTSNPLVFNLEVPIPKYKFTANITNLAVGGGDQFSLRLTKTNGTTSIITTTVTANDASLEFGELELGSDYTIEILGRIGAADCSLNSDSVPATIITDTALNADVSVDVDCNVN